MVFVVELPKSFPQLRETEKTILIRYLNLVPDGFSVEINHRFPIPKAQIPAGLVAGERVMWIATHQKRVEAILENPFEVRIIEVKERLVPSALGELLMYADLLRAEREVSKKLRLICVVEETDLLLEPTFRRAGIEIIVV